VDPHICRRLLLHDAATPPVLLLHATIGGRLPEWQTSKCISSVSFVRIESNVSYNTQETQTQKMMDQNFEIRILCFLKNFLKFSKRRRAVLLRPILAIMVAAKLDQSRVLVTKFCQNRFTLKGRSAGQRQTHRQTNSAENKGPSGLQSGQQTYRHIQSEARDQYTFSLTRYVTSHDFL